MVYAMRSGAIFIAADTTRARRAGLVPHWFLWVSYIAAGLLVVTVTYFQLVSPLIPIWVAATSLFILRRLSNIALATPGMSAVPRLGMPRPQEAAHGGPLGATLRTVAGYLWRKPCRVGRTSRLACRLRWV